MITNKGWRHEEPSFLTLIPESIVKPCLASRSATWLDMHPHQIPLTLMNILNCNHQGITRVRSTPSSSDIIQCSCRNWKNTSGHIIN
ncbi:hypothetical protein JHK85_005056 [Glycine max]|nr:hypothetical protein JHK85_005056 [Glycine max]